MSDDTNELDVTRAEQAARDYFADRAGAAFTPLDPESLKASRPRRRRAGLGLAAAACLVAALVVVPLALRPAGPIAATPEPAGPAYGELSWTTTSPSPLSPRFGALSGWVGEEYLILGGWTGGGPCPPGAMCDMAPPDGRDGARYNPATNTWTTIAETPAAFGRGYAVGAAVRDIFYAISYAEEGAFWAYHPDDDRWQRLAAPPGWGELVGVGESPVLITGDQGPAGYRYDAATDTWALLPSGPLDSCADRQGFAAGERLVVLAECAAHPDSDLQVATLDLATGSWTEPVALGAAGQGEAVHTSGKLVWPDPLTPASSFHSDGIFDIANRTWQEVAVTETAGPLAFRGMVGSTPHLVLDDLGLVAANGRLLDVATGEWVPIPDPGVPQRWDAVTTAGPGSVLDCFGYEYLDDQLQSGRYVDGCRLLTAAARQQPTAPASPSATSDEPEPTTDWRQVLADADPVPTDPLLVEAGGRYYLMGGHHSDGLDQVQLRDVRRFDPSGDRWEQLADLPDAAVSQPYTLAADVVGDLIYVHLSFEEAGELWVYDTAADSWQRVGPTQETEHYLATEDGLVRFSRLGEGTDAPAPQILAAGTWSDLPSPTPAAGPDARVVRLDDHHLGLVSDRRVAVLDTGSRTWGEPSEPGEVANMTVTGADGAAVFVDTSATDRQPTDSRGPEVAILRDGEWSYVSFPLVSDAPSAGLTPATGVAAGRWVVVKGRLLDTRTRQWQGVAALPAADPHWQARHLAGGPAGILTCFPERTSSGESSVIPSCYYLPTP